MYLRRFFLPAMLVGSTMALTLSYDNSTVELEAADQKSNFTIAVSQGVTKLREAISTVDRTTNNLDVDNKSTGDHFLTSLTDLEQAIKDFIDRLAGLPAHDSPSFASPKFFELMALPFHLIHLVVPAGYAMQALLSKQKELDALGLRQHAIESLHVQKINLGRLQARLQSVTPDLLGKLHARLHLVADGVKKSLEVALSLLSG